MTVSRVVRMASMDVLRKLALVRRGGRSGDEIALR